MNSGHIISTFRWDTTFDKKEGAFELQERLSRWSNISMPNELSGIFDKVCPPEQTWKIQSLEIDLGVVAYTNFEFELTQKLRALLNEKLTDYIIYANKGDKNIEILNENTSQIYLISSFLINGILPWSYKSNDVPVNQMLANQLQTHPKKVIAMLREAVATHANVIKRIAWQINEPNIIAIIEGLETNNSSQIIDFSNELTKVQVKATIIQTSNTDFKKDLWFWMLNYLFNERGTVFNKVAFMKSAIGQMAAHYNISYDELFELIERAVEEVTKITSIKADFISTLQALSKENKSPKNKNGTASESHVDFWLTLKDYFKSQSLQKTKAKKAEFNELVMSLSKLDKSKFRQLVLSLGQNKKLWVAITNDLNAPALEVVASALNHTGAAVIIEGIYFMHRLSREANLITGQKNFWQAGIEFLQKNQNVSFSRAVFLDYCVLQLGNSKKVPKIEVLYRLINSKIPFPDKTISNLEIYDRLTASFISGLSETGPAFLTGRISELLDLMARQATGAANDKDLLLFLQNSLVKAIRLSPQTAFKAFTNYTNKQQLRKLMPCFLDDAITRLLLKHAPLNKYEVLQTIKNVLTAFKKDKNNTELSTLIEENLLGISIHAFIFYPKLSPAGFSAYLLQQLCKLTPPGQAGQLVVFANQLADANALHPSWLLNVVKNIITNEYTGFVKAGDKPYSLHQSSQGPVALQISTNHHSSHTVSNSVAHAEAITIKENQTVRNEPTKLKADELLHGQQNLSKSSNRGDLLYTSSGIAAAIRNVINDEYTINRNEAVRDGRSLSATISANHQTTADDAVNGFSPSSFSASVKNIINKEFPGFQTDPVTVRAFNLIRTSVNRQAELGRLLNANFHDKEFTELRKAGNKRGMLIINYLSPDGEKLMGAMIEKSAATISAGIENVSKHEIAARLTELYWQCILNYKSHGGRARSIEKLFRVALSAHFPISGHLFRDELPHVRKKTFRLKNGHVLTARQFILLIKQCLAQGTAVIEKNGAKIYLNELLIVGVELMPAETRLALAKTAVTPKRIKLLKAAIPFHDFSLWIAHDTGGMMQECMEIMRLLYITAGQIASDSTAAAILNYYWAIAWGILKTNTLPAGGVNGFLQHTLSLLAKEPGLDLKMILAAMQKNSYGFTPALTAALTVCIPSFSAVKLNEVAIVQSGRLLKADRDGLLNTLVYHIVVNKQLPAWYSNTGNPEIENVLNQLVVYYPVQLLHLLKHQVIPAQQMRWLNQSIHFNQLTTAIGNLNQPQKTLLTIVSQLYVSLGKMAFSGISASDIQEILFNKVIKSWTTDNWRATSTENIWNELIWDVCVKRGVSKKSFMQQLEKGMGCLPPSLQISLGHLNAPANPVINKPVIAKQIPPLLLQKPLPSVIKTGVPVRNAGIVMISSYVQILFDRLGILAGKEFLNSTAQADAVHYLQYAATGIANTEEAFLPLNKILCGLPLSYPVKDGVEVSDEQVKLIDGLIKAVISYWPAIGACSINGFRGNWLVRDGLLTEQDDRWNLTVEKRAYDILINKSPFSFSVIKYPWMNKPLYVTWPY
jgi:hypothetical protein